MASLGSREINRRVSGKGAVLKRRYAQFWFQGGLCILKVPFVRWSALPSSPASPGSGTWCQKANGSRPLRSSSGQYLNWIWCLNVQLYWNLDYIEYRTALDTKLNVCVHLNCIEPANRLIRRSVRLRCSGQLQLLVSIQCANMRLRRCIMPGHVQAAAAHVWSTCLVLKQAGAMHTNAGGSS